MKILIRILCLFVYIICVLIFIWFSYILFTIGSLDTINDEENDEEFKDGN